MPWNKANYAYDPHIKAHTQKCWYFHKGDKIPLLWVLKKYIDGIEKWYWSYKSDARKVVSNKTYETELLAKEAAKSFLFCEKILAKEKNKNKCICAPTELDRILQGQSVEKNKVSIRLVKLKKG